MEKLRVWHFAGAVLRDGQPLPKAGETLVHDGPVVPCEQGYHGSVRAIYALHYAPGTMVALCDLHGTVVAHGDDKHAASHRTNVTDYVDATRVLHEFACWCAAQALDREEAAGRKVDPRSRAAIATKLAWLEGKATDAEMEAASAAASAAARDAARAAARAAAWEAARAAARDAASAAARAAAWEAARAAAWGAASAAAWGAARSAAWDAARAAAWDAAGAAAWGAQNTELERRLTELLEGGAK